MFDSHCHVTDIEQPMRVLSQARQAGVTSLLCCGYHAVSNAAVVELRRAVPGLPIAVGLHPWYATESVEAVRKLVVLQRPQAIGECGLDAYDRDPRIPPLAAQLPAFEAQLELAAQSGLPVTVHSRRAVNEVVAMTAHFPRVKGALHAYAGSIEQVQPLLERGWLLGIGGAMTRPGAARIRRMAARVDPRHVLFETDSPAIGLEGVKPPLVRPHHVFEVARAFAELRGLDVAEVIALTDVNARRLFGDEVFAEWAVPF